MAQPRKRQRVLCETGASLLFHTALSTAGAAGASKRWSRQADLLRWQGVCIVVNMRSSLMLYDQAMEAVAAIRASSTHKPEVAIILRSEERRVGKECRSRW